MAINGWAADSLVGLKLADDTSDIAHNGQYLVVAAGRHVYMYDYYGSKLDGSNIVPDYSREGVRVPGIGITNTITQMTAVKTSPLLPDVTGYVIVTPTYIFVTNNLGTSGGASAQIDAQAARVGNLYHTTTTVLDATTLTILGSLTYSRTMVRPTVGYNKLWIANAFVFDDVNDFQTLTAWNPTTMSIVHTTSMPGLRTQIPIDLAYNPIANEIYATKASDNSLHRYNAITGGYIDMHFANKDPYKVFAAADGNYYVTSSITMVQQFNPVTHTFTDLCSTPSPSGTSFIAANAGMLWMASLPALSRGLGRVDSVTKRAFVAGNDPNPGWAILPQTYANAIGTTGLSGTFLFVGNRTVVSPPVSYSITGGTHTVPPYVFTSIFNVDSTPPGSPPLPGSPPDYKYIVGFRASGSFIRTNQFTVETGAMVAIGTQSYFGN